MTGSRKLAWVVAAALLAGCGDSAPLIGPVDGHVAAKAAQASGIDVAGAWTVEHENFIHLDEFSAQLFGFVPEGTRTTIRCAASSLMTLQQDGSSFTGSYLPLEAVCVSSGGQSVTSPPGAPASDIVDGEIRGGSVQFTLLGEPGPVACYARGVVTELDGDTAIGLSGNWHCLEPGHPQSLWQVPAPRGGPNRTLWEAYRPAS
jgi:hypothetical protein